MKEVKVKRDALKAVLLTNRAAHQKIFEEALAGYKTKVIETLDRSLKQARAGQRVAEHISIPRPVNQTHEYNRAIRMMEMSVENEITLTTQEFDAYVMDRWHWRSAFLASNSAYSVSATLAMQQDEDADQ